MKIHYQDKITSKTPTVPRKIPFCPKNLFLGNSHLIFGQFFFAVNLLTYTPKNLQLKNCLAPKCRFAFLEYFGAIVTTKSSYWGRCCAGSWPRASHSHRHYCDSMKNKAGAALGAGPEQVTRTDSTVTVWQCQVLRSELAQGKSLAQTLVWQYDKCLCLASCTGWSTS